MKAEVFVPEVANHVPHVRVSWDAAAVGITAAVVVKAMRDGEPSIAIRKEGPALVIGVWMMQPGEDKMSRAAQAGARAAAREPKPAFSADQRTALSTFLRARGPHPRELSLGGFAPRSGRRRCARCCARARRLAERAACQPFRTPRRSASRPTWRRETTSSSTTTCPCACATASRCTPMSIARSETGAIPSSLSITPYSTERFPTAYDAAVYFAQRGYVYVFQDVRGRHESDGVWLPFRQRREGRLRHRRVGRQAARGPTARSPCRAARISGRTSGGPRRRRRRAWSPSFRWWPRPASITTGSP